jgi:hypothetical protein
VSVGFGGWIEAMMMNVPKPVLLSLLRLGCVAPAGNRPQSGVADRVVFEQFVHDPTAEGWRKLQSIAENGPGLKTNQMVLAMSNFSEAAIARDLPNSMAQDGDPNEHQRLLAIEAEKQFARLRLFAGEDLWSLTVALFSQDFDDAYHGACAEIVVRIFPSRYQSLMQKLGEDEADLLYNARFESVKSESVEMRSR